ncbi:MAG: hypothetical protein BAJALOKI1v1_880017 [Promethearchaeota archaeon]|nr:MAG: hypothetical protein BAJALOKI1v1_880017 [Candidatus Lokiarchaeota archaeon]
MAPGLPSELMIIGFFLCDINLKEVFITIKAKEFSHKVIYSNWIQKEYTMFWLIFHIHINMVIGYSNYEI